MGLDNKPSLEEVNYRIVEEGEASCIHCKYCNWEKINITDSGIIESKCLFFMMKVNEIHICDLIC